MMMPNIELNNFKYIIISPVRNEEKNIEKTILSVISQTIKPVKWIIVDDGSSDKTIEIVNKYLEKHKWISLLKLPDRGYYDLMTGGEIKAFYRGYKTIKDIDYNYLSKLDGDISFDEHYFENLLKEFNTNSKLGIAGGGCYYKDQTGGFDFEKTYKYHVRGAARIYRRECWEQIGGVIDNLGWDAIDVYKARMFRWDTISFNDIKMIHHVKTWTKGGLIHGRKRSGRMEYLMGSHPLFFCAKVVRELLRWPYVVSCYALAYGYIKSFLKKERRVVDDDLLAYIRKEQLHRLFPLSTGRNKT